MSMEKSAHHVFNHKVVNAAFGFEHLEGFPTESVFQILGPGPRLHHEPPVSIKASIRCNDVQMGIEILKIPECGSFQDILSCSSLVKGALILKQLKEQKGKATDAFLRDVRQIISFVFVCVFKRITLVKY